MLKDALNISGGEKQKLVIARELLKKSQVYFFDEPTIALDKNSIRAFTDILKGIKQDSIVVIISHDRQVLEECDNVIKICK